VGKKEKTLLDILARRATKVPGKTAFTFHNEAPCSFGQLWLEITRCAGYLLQHGLKPKDRVLIAIPNSRKFFYPFYGAQLAGGIAVPVFPGSGPERIIKLAELCGASFIVISKTNPPAREDKIEDLRQKADEKGIVLLFLEEKKEPLKEHKFTFTFPEVLPGDVAFIQFTSGSTGNPKGAQLTHGGLMENIKQMIAGMEITKSDLFVSWLPVYHDMGLILMTMVPFYLGIDLVLLPTGLHYLKSWLQAVEEWKGTFTAAPDFAYRLCLIYIRDPQNYDLSRLRVALNAAEPVRSSTINRFEEHFSLNNVLLPAYGLAEATVGVCAWKPGQPIKTDNRGFVSVGKPFPGVHMRIMQDITRAQPGNIGEIQVKSKANTIGYFTNIAATRELDAGEGFIHTGDLGYMDKDGDYYIIGRTKNIIIQSGYNIASQEIEEWADLFPFVRRSAAIGINRGRDEGEQVYIFAEVNLKRSQIQEKELLLDTAVDIVRSFNSAFGFKPGRVYLVKPGAIPMTYNGKIKYLQLKEHYQSSTLRKKNLILFPEY
jgi:acyl-CoA synthetase (AMP-forming)/AMP-acid ligase II